MKRISFNDGWRFSRGLPVLRGPMAPETGASETVTLPHDFIISTDVSPDAPSGGDCGYYVGGSGHYTKTFSLQGDEGALYLDFDGVYRDAYVKVNGASACLHHYGYTPFLVDLSPYVHAGENTVEVTVNTLPEPNSRWYTGGGIYRSVALLQAPARHIAPRGLWVRARCQGETEAELQVEVTLSGPAGTEESIRCEVYAPDGALSAAAECPAVGDVTELAIPMQNVQRWSPENPALYTLRCVLKQAGVESDSAESTFGVREIALDAENGLRINGVRVVLRGGNVHHDNGPLGAVSLQDVEYRRVKRLRDMGYNALRCAHNPPSRELLDVCDRLGMLVIDEAFDMWLSAKKDYDYHMNFTECWRQDLRDMMLRDRNHPCVIIWSIGNEIGDMFAAGGKERLRAVAAEARAIDATRPLTLGGMVMDPMTDGERQEILDYYSRFAHQDSETLESVADPSRLPPIFHTVTKDVIDAIDETMDMIDMHYEFARYPSMIRERPGSVIIGTEDKAPDTDLIWDLIERYPQIIGDFVWTAWDYIGEAGCGSCRYFTREEAEKLGAKDSSFTRFPITYPYRLSGDGDFDICGVPRVVGRWRRVVWGSDETVLATLPPKYNDAIEDCSPFAWPGVEFSWSYPGYEGQSVRVEVYSRAQEVELFVNSVSAGRQRAGKYQRYRSYFSVPYAPGVLTAVSYTDGREVSRATLETAGAPAAIALKPERETACAGGSGLHFVNIEIVDAQGRLVPWAEPEAAAEVSGAGYLAAFASGRESTEENYTAGRFTALRGRLLAVVRSAGEAGIARLRVTAPGLPAAEAELKFQ